MRGQAYCSQLEESQGKNIIGSGRAKETWFIDYMDLLSVKGKSNPYPIFSFFLWSIFQMWTFISMTSQCIFMQSLTPCSSARPSQPQTKNPYLLTSSRCAWYLSVALSTTDASLCALSTAQELVWEDPCNRVPSYIISVRSSLWVVWGEREVHVWAVVCRCVGYVISKLWM